MNTSELKNIIESLIFISGDGLSIQELSKALNQNKSEVQIIVDSLMDEYLENNKGIIMLEVANKYVLKTNPKYYAYIQDFLKYKKKETLSKATLETLAIIVYKQPITLQEIEDIRGVNSRSLIFTLLNKKLIKSLGQKATIGRPTIYGTTKIFLEEFGLNSLDDLPPPQEVKELKFDML